MHLLLVSFQTNTETLGLRLLHHHALVNGHRSTILFFPRGLGALDQAYRWIEQIRPSAIGISLMTEEYRLARAFTDGLKARTPDLPILWGGIHPTSQPEMCLESADCVCIGEGEQPLLDWLDALAEGRSPLGIPNLAIKDDHGIFHSPSLRPLIEDLDSLPPLTHAIPNAFVCDSGPVRPLDDRRFRRYSRYGGSVYSTMATRGCPLHCSFCVNATLKEVYGGKPLRIRKRSVDNVLGELKTALEENPDLIYVNFQDDCFLTLNLQWLEEFAQRYPKEIGLPFIIRPIPTFTSTEKLRLAKRAGLAWIFMGLQTGDEEVNREIYSRPQTNRKFLEAVQAVHDLKISPAYDLILDNPLEPENSIRKTLEILAQIPKPYQLNLYSLTLYPGTPLTDLMVHKRLGDPNESYTKNYTAYRKSYHNRLARMAPALPASWVRRLNRPLSEITVGDKIALTLSRPVAAITEPMVFLWLFLRSTGWRPLITFRIVRRFFLEGYYRVYLRRPGYTRKQEDRSEAYTPAIVVK